MNRRNAVLAVLALSLGLAGFLGWGSTPALAGKVHVDSTGFAAGGRDVVAYFALPAERRPVAGVPGRLQFTASWNGAVFAFATAENRDRFVADPTRYAPQFDGHCAWAAGQGYKAPGSPDVWTIIDGKLYLNYSHAIRGRWENGTAGQIATGRANWTKLADQPGATGDAGDYAPAAAPLR
jgi:hypothetical protein